MKASITINFFEGHWLVSRGNTPFLGLARLRALANHNLADGSTWIPYVIHLVHVFFPLSWCFKLCLFGNHMRGITIETSAYVVLVIVMFR